MQVTLSRNSRGERRPSFFNLKMHKLRNTKHIEILNSMLNIVPLGCSQPLSKRVIRILLQTHKWNKKEVLKEIENNEWWYRFVKE